MSIEDHIDLGADLAGLDPTTTHPAYLKDSAPDGDPKKSAVFTREEVFGKEWCDGHPPGWINGLATNEAAGIDLGKAYTNKTLHELAEEDLDFLEDDEEQTPQVLMKELATMAETLTKLEFDFVTAQEKADQAKKVYDEFRCVTLPNAFRLAGVTGLVTTNGARVTVEQKIYCSPNKNEPDQNTMCDWLESVGGSDLIKRQAIVDAAKIPELIEAQIPHSQKRDVNTNSLKAWLKRAIGIGGGVASVKLEDVPSCMHFVVIDEAQVKL